MVSEAPNGALGASGPRAPVPEARGSRSSGGAPSPGGSLEAGGAMDEALPLRLALARGSLGIELNRPERVGPVELRELALSLPDLRYPLDLSKGVKQFRSRRGRLQRLVLAVPLVEVAAWLEDSWREHLGEPLVTARVWALSGGAEDGRALETHATAPRGIGMGLYSASRSLAFDLAWCAQDGPRLLLERPRGVGIEASALTLALRAVDRLAAALGAETDPEPICRRRGRIIELRDLTGGLCRRVLPSYGCRVPATEGMQAAALELREGGLELAFDVDLHSPEAPRDVLLGLETAYRLREADDLFAEGDDEGARRALLDVLADVPGLVPAAHALAELDVAVPGRQEAALATLEEVGGAEHAGSLGAQALMSAGHVERAREALVRAGESEPFGPLAAQLLCRAAQLADHPSLRVSCLDRAVARAPQLASARWLRFEDRVRRGDVEGAVADAQHLEAAAATPSGRHRVCLRAGRRLAEGGHADMARRFLEKALRYAPDDPAARAALGRLFATLGMKSRAMTLLQSALHGESALHDGQEGLDTAELLLDLARLLGDGLDDLPQAVGRLRQISTRSPYALEGRTLEAAYCERLGDLTGASRAYARIREAVELGWVRGQDATSALRRGAELEERRGELAMAERHLYAALSLAPSDPDLRAAYRRVAGRTPGPGSLAVQPVRPGASRDGVESEQSGHMAPEGATQGGSLGSGTQVE